MNTYHIHITGLVQGVGFRPHVYRIATGMGVKGNISNTSEGVHIIATATEDVFQKFYHQVVHHPPVNARITGHHAKVITFHHYDDFLVAESENHTRANLLMTPDFGLCDDCRCELFDKDNRRYHYPFITCTSCGPRYSIITGLPYDRHATTMEPYDQCWQCSSEYYDPTDRRYYSQTNSCDVCGIPIYLYDGNKSCVTGSYDEIIATLTDRLKQGKTVAVKGIGGYLLMCDATNYNAVAHLRKKKNRPVKPFAVLYPSLQMAENDLLIDDHEKQLLTDVTAPIVLCRLREKSTTGICANVLAPGLNRLGVMLPYGPLIALIADGFGKPLVATSGNISGSPIIYKDEDALEKLSGFADHFVTYDREIVVPQDDSVIHFSPRHHQKIITRRSRGLAPNFYDPTFDCKGERVLAMGAELKSSFALMNGNNCFISQFLGDQQSYEAQQGFNYTLKHLQQLLHWSPQVVLVDKHPNYHVSNAGRELARAKNLPCIEVQHHQAHLCAVLAENDCLDTADTVLGVTWDGTGYGDDGQIWGGEFFLYQKGDIKRYAQLDYFPVLSGDAMPRQPRLSALSLLGTANADINFIKEKFTEQEWQYFSRLLQQDSLVDTSSAGRLLDGIASLLDIRDTAAFEGDAAMQLEAVAARYTIAITDHYPFEIVGNKVKWQPVIQALIEDIQQGEDKRLLASKIHLTLVRIIEAVARQANVTTIAFSGGVFQNALLVDLLHDHLHDHRLLFHQQLSPNDECISFGQLAYYHLQLKHKQQSFIHQNEQACV